VKYFICLFPCQQISHRVLENYLNSDFNGTLFNDIARDFGGYAKAKKYIKNLVNKGVLELISANNPHIRAFDFSKHQKNLLNELFLLPNNVKRKYVALGNIKLTMPNEYSNFSVYPTPAYIRKNINNNKKYLEQAPFTKMMSFGTPWLEPLYFRVDVLDRYMEDPRYNVRYGDFGGDISFNSDDEEHKEQMYLKHFGLAHNKNTKENLICVWACDLHKLENRHQYHFYSYMEEPSKEIVPDYDYYRTQILGEWTNNNSIYVAFLEEIKVINEMTKVICGKQLFKHEYEERDRYKLEGFHPFLKPTERILERFCQTLDKLFTENLDKNTILEIDSKCGGKLSSNPKTKELGTLAILENFIKLYFNPNDKTDVIHKVIDIWKNRTNGIRAIRSKAAHYVRDNKYDLTILKKYKDLINKSYDSIRFLRLIFSNHPQVRASIEKKEIIIPDWLFDGNIRGYFI